MVARRPFGDRDRFVPGSDFGLGGAQQMAVILNDYVEAAIMLDYNDRDVAAAWY